MPVYAVLLGICGGCRSRTRRLEGRVARSEAAVALPPVRRVWRRSRASPKDLMERRVFLAILLSFTVLFAYQAFFAPKPPLPPAQSAQPGSAATPGAASPQISSALVTPPPAAADAPAPLVADTDARDIVVDTEAVHAVFNARGAVLKSWKLKRYPGEDGQPLDLVPSDLPPSEARPFTLKTGDAALDQQLANALFKPTPISTPLERD